MKDELLEFIRDAVKNHFEATQAATDGASLAEQVRIRFSGKSVADAGFEKLSDAVREAESRGYVARNRQVKHLEVLPAGVSIPPPKEKDASHSTYIRPDAWHAFAMQVNSSEAKYDPVTGQLIVGNTIPQGRDDLVDVKTPSNNDFGEWIEIFASEIGVEIPSEVVQSDCCLREFSKWILTTGTINASRWKKFRARKVADAIRDWGKQAGIDVEPFFTPVIPNYKRKQAIPSQGVPCDDARASLIKCVLEMSDAELDAIAIPYRLVRAHFRPQ